MKMNKKGFTLIEMLVVIAIIAVLVSIIVPTVSKSTVKAAAATDAANLRSAKATLTIAAMDDKLTETTTATAVTDELLGSAVPECKSEDGLTMNYIYDEDTGVVVFFGEDSTKNTIAAFSDIAENGAPTTEKK